MIWYLVGMIPQEILLGLSGWFGLVDKLPSIGGVDMDWFFSMGVANAQQFLHLIPPLALGLQVLFAWVGFLLLLRIARAIPFIGRMLPQD